MSCLTKVPDCELPRVINPTDLTRHRIRRAEVVLRLVLEERCSVPERRRADREHVRILGLKYDLIKLVGKKTVSDADLCRIGRAWKRVRRAAARPGPVAARNLRYPTDDAVDGLVVMRLQ